MGKHLIVEHGEALFHRGVAHMRCRGSLLGDVLWEKRWRTLQLSVLLGTGFILPWIRPAIKLT